MKAERDEKIRRAKSRGEIVDYKRNIYKAQISPTGEKYMPIWVPDNSTLEYVKRVFVNAPDARRIVNITADYNNGFVTVHYNTGATFTIM